jgi:hypothetical protein
MSSRMQSLASAGARNGNGTTETSKPSPPATVSAQPTRPWLIGVPAHVAVPPPSTRLAVSVPVTVSDAEPTRKTCSGCASS